MEQRSKTAVEGKKCGRDRGYEVTLQGNLGRSNLIADVAGHFEGFPPKALGECWVGSTNKTPWFIWFLITSQELM